MQTATPKILRDKSKLLVAQTKPANPGHILFALAAGSLVLLSLVAHSAPNISATRHNLSTSGTGTFKAVSTSGVTEVCVFCHTPHGKENVNTPPLWNRTVNTSQTYTVYSSGSIQASDLTQELAQPGAESKLCLSCHDGMLAVNTVSVLAGRTDRTIEFPGGSGGRSMPAGSGTDSGFTRNLGIDLRNDHPISMTFDTTLANADGEMRDPASSSGRVAARTLGVKPTLPLDSNNKVQCVTCHDPHFDTQKFLRVNRFQTIWSGIDTLNISTDQICLVCHSKLGKPWRNSAHAKSTIADETYNDDAADRRDFPRGTRVWEAGCLNCHDTHTVAGSRRLLREGVNSARGGTGGGSFYQGDAAGDPNSVSAIENTCYQCHDAAASTTQALTNAGLNNPPDIKTEFARARRMPIVSSAQGNGGPSSGREIHDIQNADFEETTVNLGRAASGGPALINRHAECTDCHNPHRVIRNSILTGSGGDESRRTHVPAAGTNGALGNVASGVLRGIWGVEPNYSVGPGSTSWPELPVTYTEKRGDPEDNPSVDKGESYLTREYQLCFKCHSNYANSDTAAEFPSLGYPGGTPSGTNGVSRYTNVAAEFSAHANDLLTGLDQGENGNDPTRTPGNPNGAPNSAPTNHRSWHPVVFPTGRTPYERTGSSTGTFSNIRPPFSNAANVGKQTMQCSDCHGSEVSWTQGTSRTDTNNGPNLSAVQGPHGSGQNFLLKGKWDISVKIGDASGGNSTGTLCGRCHDPQNGSGGFSNGDAAHSKSDHTSLARCMFCHIAVPHGWKNKAFLANLRCIGPEVGKPTGCTNAFGDSGEVTRQLWVAPYYNGALLRITSWRSSNAWTETSCGGGSGWMSGTCENASTTQQSQSTGY